MEPTEIQATNSLLATTLTATADLAQQIDDKALLENQVLPAAADNPLLAAIEQPLRKRLRETTIHNTQNAYNPTLPDDEDSEILENIRGDAIGSTLYSSRFVIATLLKLRDVKDPLESDESFEKELESLWDMTIEKDVVLMLLQLDVFDVFTQSMLKYPSDGRLIEILTGIMGNMCSVAEEALDILCKSETNIDVLIRLIANKDSGVLIQLMRLYAIAFGKSTGTALAWSKRILIYDEFVHSFCFIMANSCNTSLLLHSLEALNAILAKSATIANEVAVGVAAASASAAVKASASSAEMLTFLRLFLNLKVSESIKQAFLTFHEKETVYTGDVDNGADGDGVDEDFNESISESMQKAFIIFLNIEEIIFNYAFDDVFNAKTATELKSCLLIIISTISTPIFVLPNNFDYLHSVLDIFKEFFSAVASLHDENMACYVANMWEILRKLKARQPTSGVVASTNGFDDDYDDLLDAAVNESLNKLLQLTQTVLKIMLQKYETTALEVIMRRLSPLDAFKLFEAFGVELSAEFIEELHFTTAHCEQLKIALTA